MAAALSSVHVVLPMMKRILQVHGELPKNVFRVSSQVIDNEKTKIKPWKIFVYGCSIGWPSLNELSLDIIARHPALQTSEVVKLFADAEI